MKTFKISISVFIGFLVGIQLVSAQNVKTYSIQQLTDAALKNNHILAIKQWQVEEKKAKIKEDEIKRLPVVSLSGTYQYNLNLADITIPAGTIGVIPLSATNQVLLPNEDRTFKVGEKSTYNAGATVYQPISQQAKVKTGIELSKLDVSVSEKEKQKIALQIKHGIEQLYFGILISQKQMEEAQAKLALAQARLADVENALLSGKTIDVNKAGLMAGIADEEQNMLKLDFQIQNYKADMAKLTGIKAEDFNVDGISDTLPDLPSMDSFASEIPNNPDLQLTELTRARTELGIKAAKQSNRPDVGLVAGYVVQGGNPIMPMNNPFVGLSLKWNIQDLYANKQVLQQRTYQLKQAEENIMNTRQQLAYDIEKAYRKARQSMALVNVAEKALQYRREELKLQNDRLAAGMNLKTDVLNTRALTAKAEADVYSARLAYILAISDINELIGK
ncbi:TolC family protein [Emticicia sp. 21SJ11W-3]|uniref:TolC family protein n=1 Tax=Emticicia sp. 21SJ11W-3 TaxID=2916755 RepID=UPI0020A0E135|nr:TolC family protein [Emticicia sp. 21SJ11W-3]UTA68692.1 TolC family protein [Emticicia sp. 21SJ11W-3]